MTEDTVSMEGYTDMAAVAGSLEHENERLRECLGSIDADGIRTTHPAPYDNEIKSLCEKHGYGAVMDSAARMWFLKDPNGALTVGPCAAIVRAALNPTTDGEG